MANGGAILPGGPAAKAALAAKAGDEGGAAKPRIGGEADAVAKLAS